jgi:hypothetical protein
MKRLIASIAASIALTAILCFAQAPLADAADQPDQPAGAGSQTGKGDMLIVGDLLKIEGEFYVVKDASGKEVRLHVNKDTKVVGNIKAGDKIEAQATDKGHAASIKPAM